MSKIIEVKEKIARELSPDFVPFETLIYGGREGEEGADPLERLKNEQEKARQETEAMLARARAEKKTIEEDAYRKGFTRGEEEGARAAEKKFADQLAQAARLIGALGLERARVHQQYEADMLALIKTMVERLVGHEVSVNPLVIVNCLRQAMEYVVEDSVVKVHLQSDDLQHIREMSLEDPSLLEGTRRVELIEDPAVSRGGCLLTTDFGEIDATLENCRERLFAIVERAFFAALAADGSK